MWKHSGLKKAFAYTLRVVCLVIVVAFTLHYIFHINGYKPSAGDNDFHFQSSQLIRNAAGYKISKTISLHDVHDIVISGLAISGGNEPLITLKNCYNIRITANRLNDAAAPGIHLYQCKNIVIEHNYITNVSSGVYVQQGNFGGIVIRNNEFLNMLGPLPRGQFVQFDHVNGAGCLVADNKFENQPGKSNAEDAISLYMSNGTAASPITVKRNLIRGGGPSKTGGGIALGDAGGSYQLVEDNILVDPGQYGIGIAGGTNMQVLNNKIYAKENKFTNVGISVWNQYESNSLCALIVVKGNQVNWTNSKGQANHSWNNGNCGPVEGWDSNSWGANITPAVLPFQLISQKNMAAR